MKSTFNVSKHYSKLPLNIELGRNQFFRQLGIKRVKNCVLNGADRILATNKLICLEIVKGCNRSGTRCPSEMSTTNKLDTNKRSLTASH